MGSVFASLNRHSVSFVFTTVDRCTVLTDVRLQHKWITVWAWSAWTPRDLCQVPGHERLRPGRYCTWTTRQADVTWLGCQSGISFFHECLECIRERLMVVSSVVVHDGMETVHVTLLRRALVSSP